ncbi:MAG: mechanosensitive ion channel [Saprospiraceae bacterium]|nr:mechanosensitive ion channel [Saprospiraceae bacterium]
MQLQSVEEQANAALESVDSFKEGFLHHLPNIILATIVLALFWFLASVIANGITKSLKKRMKNKSIASLFGSLLRALLVGLGIFIALSILGLDKAVTALLTGAGVAGLAVGFAVQNPLGNTFAGFLLSFRDDINIGDWIETNGFAGEVVDLDLKGTTLRGADNNMIIVPNKLVLEAPYKNHSLTTRTLVKVSCGVDYSSNLEHVRRTVLSTLCATFPHLKEEEIIFFYDEFADSSINFQTRFWMDAKSAIQAIYAKSEAIMAIKKAFEREGITIPFPIRTILGNDGE